MAERRWPKALTVASTCGPLPSAAALHLAKTAAFAACAAAAYRTGWPLGSSGHALIDRAPLVALDALSRTCPMVERPLLARCLELDPHTAPGLLRVLKGAPDWPAAIVDRVVQTLQRAAA